MWNCPHLPLEIHRASLPQANMVSGKKSVLDALVCGSDSDSESASDGEAKADPSTSAAAGGVVAADGDNDDDEDGEPGFKKPKKGSITLDDLERAGYKSGPSVLLMKPPEEQGQTNWAWCVRARAWDSGSNGRRCRLAAWLHGQPSRCLHATSCGSSTPACPSACDHNKDITGDITSDTQAPYMLAAPHTLYAACMQVQRQGGKGEGARAGVMAGLCS